MTLKHKYTKVNNSSKQQHVVSYRRQIYSFNLQKPLYVLPVNNSQTDHYDVFYYN